MTNPYFSAYSPLPRNQLARAEALNAIFDAIIVGFDQVPSATGLAQDRLAYCVDSGTANSYVLTPPTPTASYVDGARYSFKALNTNTGASTANISGVGVVAIKRQTGADLAANDIVAGAVQWIQFDGTKFQLMSFAGSDIAASAASATAAAGSATAANTSAISAGTSATSSTASQTAAAISATSASNSATSAAASATAAAASVSGNINATTIRLGGQALAGRVLAASGGGLFNGAVSATGFDDLGTAGGYTSTGFGFTANLGPTSISATYSGFAIVITSDERYKHFLQDDTAKRRANLLALQISPFTVYDDIEKTTGAQSGFGISAQQAYSLYGPGALGVRPPPDDNPDGKWAAESSPTGMQALWAARLALVELDELRAEIAVLKASGAQP